MAPAASTSTREDRVRQASVARSAGATTASAATMPSSRITGTAMVTVPGMTAPSLRAMPSATTAAKLGGQRGRIGDRSEDLVLHVRRRVGEEHVRDGPAVQRLGDARFEGDAEGVRGLLLLEADRGEAQSPADECRLAGLLDEHREDRVGAPDRAPRS